MNTVLFILHDNYTTSTHNNRVVQLSIHYTVSGSGYSTPKVSTVTDSMRCSSIGRSLQSVGVSAIALTTSCPSITLPKAA